MGRASALTSFGSHTHPPTRVMIHGKTSAVTAADEPPVLGELQIKWVCPRVRSFGVDQLGLVHGSWSNCKSVPKFRIIFLPKPRYDVQNGIP